jgi:hypothetical protein
MSALPAIKIAAASGGGSRTTYQLTNMPGCHLPIGTTVEDRAL